MVVNLKKVILPQGTVYVPADEKSGGELAKMGWQFSATVRRPRNYEHHKKLFAIIGIAVEQGVLDRDLEYQGLVCNWYAINAIRLKYKDDVYSLLYILKYYLLPLESVMLPDGTETHTVSSIKFEAMEQSQFEKFYTQAVSLMAGWLGISEEVLNGESHRHEGS